MAQQDPGLSNIPACNIASCNIEKTANTSSDCVCCELSEKVFYVFS